MVIRQKFERIFGFIPDQRSLQHLETIVDRFSSIPYENLTKIIQLSQVENPEDRMRKPGQVLDEYLWWRAGGTCFSLTNCLREILGEYGYVTAVRMADLGSRINNHCALTVWFEDREFLMDPGYLITSPLPLPLTGTLVHSTRLHPVRIEKNQADGSFYLSTMEPEGEKYRYRLHEEKCSEENFKALWIDSFSWSMMHSLLITKVIPEGRLYLHDRHFRYITQQVRKGDKIRSQMDLEISKLTGIDAHLVRLARSYLAQHKPELREK
jgi:arylamine N-acetyltransferase